MPAKKDICYILLLYVFLLGSCSKTYDTGNSYKPSRVYKENHDKLRKRVFSWFAEYGVSPGVTYGVDSNKKYEVLTARYKKESGKSALVQSEYSKDSGKIYVCICNASVRIVSLDDSTTSVTVNMDFERNPEYEIDRVKLKANEENFFLNYLNIIEDYLDKENENLEAGTFDGINLANSKWNMWYYWIKEFKAYKTQISVFELALNQDSIITITYPSYIQGKNKRLKGKYSLAGGFLVCKIFVCNTQETEYKFALRNGFLVGKMKTTGNDIGRCYGRRSEEVIIK